MWPCYRTCLFLCSAAGASGLRARVLWILFILRWKRCKCEVPALRTEKTAAFCDKGYAICRKSGILRLTNRNLSGDFLNFSYFTGFSAHYIVKWYVFSLIFSLMRNPQRNKGNFCLSIARYFIKKSCGIPFCFSCWVSVNIHFLAAFSISVSVSPKSTILIL